MSVSDGQNADEVTFNDAFMSRNEDTSTTGQVDLKNVDAPSGASIANIQRAINSLCSSLGISNAEAYNFLIAWASAIVGSASSSAKDKIDALTLKFRGTATLGHNHDGTDGQGEKVSAASLDAFNNYWLAWQKIGPLSVSGTSHDVSAQMSGKSPGGGASAAGVLTGASQNRVEMIDDATKTFLEDSEGQRIYGRITESAGTWTVTFYKFEGGSEVSHSFGSPVSANFLFREVFTSAFRPTIGENPFEFGTLDVTADVVDASATQRGLVSILAQAFAGDKTFNDALEALSEVYGSIQADGATTGSNATAAAPAKTILRLTNASLVSISTIPAPSKPQLLIIRNFTGSSVSLIQGSSIETGTGADLPIADKASVFLFYDTTETKWAVIGGSGGTSFGNQSANTVLAGPSTGSPAAPTFRSLVSDDIPTLDISTKTSGTLAISRGGTGQTTKTAAFDALSPTTTKGDLILNDGTNNVRKAAGTNGHRLTARSSDAEGAAWEAPETWTYSSAVSTAKTPPSSGVRLQMSGNSIVVPEGQEWHITGQIEATRPGASPGYSRVICYWTGANGDDVSTSTPAGVSGIIAGTFIGDVQFDPVIGDTFMNAPTIRLLGGVGGTTVFLVPLVAMQIPANARIYTYIYGMRVK